MPPVVACASKEAQAADLKLQLAALKESVADKERERLHARRAEPCADRRGNGG
jgi:hypothetical protein